MTSRLTKQLIKIAKWGWLVLIFGAVLFYFVRNFDTITQQLQAVSLPRLLLAHVLLIGGKLLLVEHSRQSVAAVNHSSKFGRMFYIYAMSQLAKYLPGAIWQYVGRAGYYHADGLTIKDTTRAMIIENVWLIFSASISGIIAYILYHGESPLLAAGMLMVWFALLALLFRVYTGQFRPRQALVVLVLQAAIWCLLGFSLWAILPLDTPRIGLLAVGAFGISWTVGYVTIFAPGGIGVREGVLTAILAVVIAPADALIYAAVNRIVWVISELSLGLVARTFFATKQTEQLTEQQAIT